MSAYSDAVKALLPDSYWRLGEASGIDAANEIVKSHTDDFTGTDNDPPDVVYWSVDNPAHSYISGNRLYMEADPIADPMVYANSSMFGDFDVAIDYDLTGSDFGSGAGYIQLVVRDEAANDEFIMRYYVAVYPSQPPRLWAGKRTPSEITYAFLDLTVGDFVTGKFRIRKIGADLEFYYWDTDWVLLYTKIAATYDNEHVVQLHTNAWDTNPLVICHWDNFSMVQENNGEHVNTPTLGSAGLLNSDSATAIQYPNGTSAYTGVDVSNWITFTNELSIGLLLK